MLFSTGVGWLQDYAAVRIRMLRKRRYYRGGVGSESNVPSTDFGSGLRGLNILGLTQLHGYCFVKPLSLPNPLGVYDLPG